MQTYEEDGRLAQLLDHPRNPRQGNDASVGRSIDRNGWYGAIVAQLSTGYILAGHTRRRALAASGTLTAPIIWLDCDDATALAILLADNRTAELAVWDDSALLALLGEVQDISSVGFTEFDIEALMRKVQPLDITPGEAAEPNIDPKTQTCPECGHTWAQ